MSSQIEMLLRNTSARIESLDEELLGTGIILPWGDKQAVLTCAHLLPAQDDPENKLKICFRGEYRAVSKLWTPEGVDQFSQPPKRPDIALLTLEAPFPGVEPIAWNSKFPEAGSPVWFHGWRAGQDNPETIRTSVSAWNNEFGMVTLQDAPAKGTSGGPVCVEDGSTLHIVGMIVARVVDTAARGMYLPASTIKEALPDLPVGGTTEISDRATDLRRRLLAQMPFSLMFELRPGLLGHSQRTTVFQARDLQLQREIAIKVLDPDCGKNERDEFVSDVRVAANFDHPNIVRIHGAMFDQPLALYVMQYIDGLQLAAIIKRAEEPLDTTAMIEIVRQVADALIYMHQRGFVHGNVCDDNIRIDRARIGKMHAVISAFGVTPAPSDGEPSARPGMLDDQYCLGRVAQDLIHRVFTGPPPQELAEVVMRMADLRPEHRYLSIAKAMEAFEQAIDESGLGRDRHEPHSTEAERVPPEPLSAEVVDRARIAYERWVRMPVFFESFYGTLFATHPEIRKRFEGGKGPAKKLQQALEYVLLFPTGRADVEPLLARIAVGHSSAKLNIQPHLYPIFQQALLDTATRRDPEFDDQDRQAWRAVLSYTFDYMKSRYADS